MRSAERIPGMQMAADCRYLRRTIDSKRLDGPVVTLCTHPTRDGFDCVGPFMDEIDTECRLWEISTEAQRRRDADLGAGRGR